MNRWRRIKDSQEGIKLEIIAPLVLKIGIIFIVINVRDQAYNN